MKEVLGFGMALALALAIFAVGGVAIIWSLNTLFGLGIAYTFKTWMAAVVLGGVFYTSKGGDK